jgi:hypothetical protein
MARIDDQNVPVSGGKGAAFDLNIKRDRIRPRIAFVGVIEDNTDFWLQTVYGSIRDTYGTAIP